MCCTRGARAAWSGAVVAASRSLGGASEVEEMGALGVVEQGSGERVEHAVGDAIHVAAFEPGVARHADSGQDGDLLPAQPQDAAAAVAG